MAQCTSSNPGRCGDCRVSVSNCLRSWPEIAASRGWRAFQIRNESLLDRLCAGEVQRCQPGSSAALLSADAWPVRRSLRLI